MSDWFRQTVWQKETEDFFFRKLARARKESRPQYLKIQAVELISIGTPTALNAAEMLLQKLVNDYPENRIEKSENFQSLGDIYRLKGDVLLSLNYYKKALDFEEIYPNVKTQAYLSYAEIIIQLKRQECYSFIQSLIENRITNSPFPIERYLAYSFLSILNFRTGNYNRAIEYSDMVEQSVSAKTADVRYHSDLGLVVKRKEWLDDLIISYKNGHIPDDINQ